MAQQSSTTATMATTTSTARTGSLIPAANESLAKPGQQPSYMSRRGPHISDQPWTLSNWYLHIDWFKTTLLVFIPLVAAYYACYTPLTRPTLILSVLLHLWAGIGITAGYHRLWSHCSYTATLPLQVFLGFGGASALEGSIRFWSWGHRAHHRFTDTDADPYTVHKGLWHAHMGWLLLNQDYKKHGRTDISDLANDPFVVWQHKYYAPISIFFAWVMPTLVAGLGWGDWKGGLVYAGVLRVVTVQQSSFTINSLGHYLGDQPFDDRRSPRDHWISSLFSLGEGYHNFHHEFPTDYRNTTRWLTYDPNKWCIATWKWLGLASDLRTFSQNEIDKGKLQQEQKKLDRKLGVLDWGKPLTMLPLMEWEEFVDQSSTRALIAVAGLVHDVTDFAQEHPGGKALILTAVGKDATSIFNGGVYNHSNAARNLLAKYRVGIIRGGGEVEIWKVRAQKRAEMIRDYDYSIVGSKEHMQCDWQERRALAQVSKTFNSPIDRTWAIWSSFGAAHLYIDGCSSARLEGYGVGATRALAFGGGVEMRETLRYMDPGSHTFAYTIEDAPGLPARGSLGLVSLQRRGDSQTEIIWKGFAEEVTPEAEAGLSEQLVRLYNSSIEKARQTLEK